MIFIQAITLDIPDDNEDDSKILGTWDSFTIYWEQVRSNFSTNFKTLS